MKPKVLFINHAAGLGGGELFLLDLLEAHDQLHFNASTLIFQHGPLIDRIYKTGTKIYYDEKPLAFLRLKRGSNIKKIIAVVPSVISLIIRCLSIIKSYDIVIANSQKALFIAGPAAFIKRKKFIWILHDLIDDRSFSKVLRRMAILFANCFCVKVIANSQATLDSFVLAGGRSSSVSVVYNGFSFANVDDLMPDRHKKELFLSEFSLKNITTIGVFGRVCEWKGQHILLETLKTLPDCQAIIAGDATYEDEGYLTGLKNEVESSDLKSRVRFLGFRTDIKEIMDFVDIVVHTSTSPEPFGRVIVEAMARKRPVIATDAGGVREIIEDGVNGFLVQPGRISELREALWKISDDRKLSERIAKEGYSSAKAKFSMRASLASINRIIDNI